jgi:hypothetical protein
MIEDLIEGCVYDYTDTVQDNFIDKMEMNYKLLNPTESGFKEYAVKVSDSTYIAIPYQWAFAKGGKIYYN